LDNEHDAVLESPDGKYFLLTRFERKGYIMIDPKEVEFVRENLSMRHCPTTYAPGSHTIN
jgi:hypothetical protein